MSIKLDENYRIESDYASWNLVFEKTGAVNPKTGKPTYSKDVTYHANIKQALQWYCDTVLKNCDSISAVIAKIDALHAKIDALDFGGKQ